MPDNIADKIGDRNAESELLSGEFAVDPNLRSTAAPYILVVDDEPDIRNLLQEILQDEGYEVNVAQNGSEAREAHRARRPDLVLLDIWMPDVDGITILKEWSHEGRLPIPVIMMSGHGTVETAVEATRLGAYDFIEKPLSLAKLLLTVEHALEADKLQRENVGLRRRGQSQADIIGRSATMQRLREQIKRIAEHDTWILMNGEPGTELDVVARYMHNQSDRSDRPFIDVNVATLNPKHSAEELFGTESGDKIEYGLMEQASGGTLYLHDMGDMDLKTQAKFLSALQKKSFQRVGGSEPVNIHVRIVAATNRDLEELVADGSFRKDLYYQLNVVPLSVPPLREHHEDVPELLQFYTNLYVEQENLPYRKFAMSVQNRLRNYHWPGNLRELMNLVQRLLIIGSGNEIDMDEISTHLSDQHGASSAPNHLNVDMEIPLREAREQFEKAYILHQLQKTNGSVGKTAQAIGLERTHLYRKLRALDIDPKNLPAE